ncbi:ataxin-2 homolog isoform X2 [Cimex lectularius]|uniref:LsmAD domain-containing protein n=1 Tax=Cimex lectularius TaxID=79782 RepID=A0A8I6RJY2_CIMLE|nr:ataxin-2 homolog isoform X2 [Cimex lectularius]XP_014246412.1 ataxin-2 homolog isoform X2 [Cimex lectularius]XP_014246413.1 ataxin-2 homolog isoform X2 [Cimex lectularius]XP_024085767.1 ataxin-2 homolog isoform X2 [Cimex lectularius]XP_024085768.1 ataxin-2 homolog isoform X2 [Cimex lectularius]XP_024085769.1 ataxin-2 homolog isoform X2 [Cimex lectularius]XP_024085770.1 ataxin-2 homolog isoform X2 [Cimex lectularius]
MDSGPCKVGEMFNEKIFKPQEEEIMDTNCDNSKINKFKTDLDISKFDGKMVAEKELVPWDDSSSGKTDVILDGTQKGWNANEMFRWNEKMYGVKSDFDPELSLYTLPLPKKDSKDYREAEAKAEKIANEIEKNQNYKARIELENNDEEMNSESNSLSNDKNSERPKPQRNFSCSLGKKGDSQLPNIATGYSDKPSGPQGDSAYQIEPAGTKMNLQDEKAIKSTLNPNAKEFIFRPKPNPVPSPVYSVPKYWPHHPQLIGYSPIPVPVHPVMFVPSQPYYQVPYQMNRYWKDS